MPVINSDNPIELSRAVVVAYKPTLFFRKMCKTITHKTKSFILDVSKKTRYLSPYLRDNEDGKVVARDGYESTTFTPPKCGNSRPLTSNDLYVRQPGESIVEISAENQNPEVVQTKLLVADLLDLHEYVERREEQQIVEILTTGKIVTGVGKDINSTIPSENIFSAQAADKFDAANSTPIQYLQKVGREKVSLNGGSAVRKAVFGSDAYDAFLNNSSVKSFLDSRRIDLGSVEPREDQEFPGVIYQGKVGGIEIYTYDEYYFDEKKNKNVEMMPKDKVILIAGNARFEEHYGAVADGAHGTVNKTQIYAWEWIQNKTRYREVESRPLFVPANGGAVATIKVV